MALSAMPTHLALTFAPRDSAVFSKELFDDDVDFSDDDSMTGDSSDASLAFSPTSMQTHAKDAGSPSSVAQVAEASTPSWPARPLRRKRNRMSQEERKVRHREVQRQFMKRKRARIAELRKVEAVVEKELRFVRMLQEIEQLQKENDTLEKQIETCDQKETPAESVMPRSFGDLVFSVPTQEDETQKNWDISELEWSDILDVLSDDGCADIAAEVDMCAMDESS